MPPTASILVFSAAAKNSSNPKILLWSVKATAEIPFLTAKLIISVGVFVPSEKQEWVCKSQIIISLFSYLLFFQLVLL